MPAMTPPSDLVSWPDAPVDTNVLCEAEIAAAEAAFTQATRILRKKFILEMRPYQEALDAKIDAIYKKYGIP